MNDYDCTYTKEGPLRRDYGGCGNCLEICCTQKSNLGAPSLANGSWCLRVQLVHCPPNTLRIMAHHDRRQLRHLTEILVLFGAILASCCFLHWGRRRDSTVDDRTTHSGREPTVCCPTVYGGHCSQLYLLSYPARHHPAARLVSSSRLSGTQSRACVPSAVAARALDRAPPPLLVRALSSAHGMLLPPPACTFHILDPYAISMPHFPPTAPSLPGRVFCHSGSPGVPATREKKKPIFVLISSS